MAEKRALVVYYSRTGTTRKVAEAMAEMLQCETEEIIDRKDRSGAIGYLASGRDAVRKKAADIEPPAKDPADYDLVVVGTPVWALTMSCATRAYLAACKDRLPQVAFFCTTGGSGIDRTFRHMQELCEKGPVAVLGLRMKEVLKGDVTEAVRAFVGALS